MHRPATVAALVLSLTAAPAGAQETAGDFDAYVARAVADWETTGLAIAVVRDGETVFARGYGVRNLDDGGPVDADTLFAIGSTTKAMTATCMAMLVASDEATAGSVMANAERISPLSNG